LHARETIERCYLIAVHEAFGKFTVQFAARGLQRVREPNAPGTFDQFSPKALVFTNGKELQVEWSILPSDWEVTTEDFEEVAKAKVREKSKA
jgi:hypothetical protein